MKHKLMLVSLSALALAACGGNETAGGADTANLTVPEAETMMGDNMAANMADAPAAISGQQFADTAAASDAYELESSKLARDKAESAAVKEFAAMMVEDHTSSTAKLKDAAGRADPAITPNPTMNAEQTANLEALRTVSGAAFDTLYKQQQIAAHQKALAALQDYAANGDVPALKTFAGETAKVVEGHLKRANSM